MISHLRLWDGDTLLRDFAETIQLCMSCNLQLKPNSEVFAQVFEEQLEINCDVVYEEQDFIIKLKVEKSSF